MSTKSTIYSEPCCHVYKDVTYDGQGESELLCIDVSYGAVEDYDGDCDNDFIQVEWDSDFAKLIRKAFAGMEGSDDHGPNTISVSDGDRITISFDGDKSGIVDAIKGSVSGE